VLYSPSPRVLQAGIERRGQRHEKEKEKRETSTAAMCLFELYILCCCKREGERERTEAGLLPFTASLIQKGDLSLYLPKTTDTPRPATKCLTECVKSQEREIEVRDEKLVSSGAHSSATTPTKTIITQNIALKLTFKIVVVLRARHFA
jgi:hypothetical protein